MSKFVIECPVCGRYTEGSDGLFSSNRIKCSCGNTIKVNKDKLKSTQCPFCDNYFVYDQTKNKQKCPVCGKKVKGKELLGNSVDFDCPTCGLKLSANKTAGFYTCPLCDTKIDIANVVEKEKIRKEGIISVIKYEGPNDVFVWKHPIEDFNMGSQLIVHESQEAIFFKDGKALDLFGSGRYTLATQNLPILENLYKLPTGGNEVFHSEVYFINLVTQMGIKWGTDTKVRMFDPASGLHIEIGACGNFNLRVNDSRKLLLKVVGTTGGLGQTDVLTTSTGLGAGKFKAMIMNKVKSNLARLIKEKNINILEVDSYMDILSDAMKETINVDLDEYGMVMPEFYITTIMTPDDDPDFRRLKKQFAEKTLVVRQEEIRKAEAEAAQGRKIVEAQTEAQLKVVSAQGEAEAIKLKAQAEAEAYKMQAFAEAAEMQAKGYTYQQETARQVGLEAMQNGITGGSGGSGGSLGDLAGLGVTLGAMGGVINMTKEAMNPIMGQSTDIGAGFGAVVAGQTVGTQGNAQTGTDGAGQVVSALQNGSWICPSCGKQDITSKFCPECGAAKPIPVAADSWTCPGCGMKGISSKFCPECGTKRPEVIQNAVPNTWICPECGTKDINGKFCPECGRKRDM